MDSITLEEVNFWIDLLVQKFKELVPVVAAAGNLINTCPEDTEHGALRVEMSNKGEIKTYWTEVHLSSPEVWNGTAMEVVTYSTEERGTLDDYDPFEELIGRLARLYDIQKILMKEAKK